MIETIQRQYPGHGVRGEERDLGTGAETYQWICDPLDGTLPYLNGLPNSLFMLALTRESEVLAAVPTIRSPITCTGRPDRAEHFATGGGFASLASGLARDGWCSAPVRRASRRPSAVWVATSNWFGELASSP